LDTDVVFEFVLILLNKPLVLVAVSIRVHQLNLD